MKKGWKEFHLVAEPVEREFAPGMVARLWGYNGQSPGPTIEVVEGDKVRIFVTNRLPEHTTIHWHGQRLPNGMDGVGGLNQPQIKPGQTYVYEFVARRPGTFMYHPHADEMVQMAMGMMGFWVTHPRDPNLHRVDRDFVFLLNAYDVVPGSATPRINTMLDFNLWTWNSRVFPGIDPLACRLGDRVRIRIGNLTMTNHPIHLHGHEFVVTGTDGGWTPPASRWPEVTTDVAVGQMRAIEFDATEPGDWAFHCHKSHHTMNAMGHDVPDHDRRAAGRPRRGDQRPHSRLHDDGIGRHGGNGRDGDATAGQHAADDDRYRTFRAARNGRACSPPSRSVQALHAMTTRTRVRTPSPRGRAPLNGRVRRWSRFAHRTPATRVSRHRFRSASPPIIPGIDGRANSIRTRAEHTANTRSDQGARPMSRRLTGILVLALANRHRRGRAGDGHHGPARPRSRHRRGRGAGGR